MGSKLEGTETYTKKPYCIFNASTYMHGKTLISFPF